MEAAARQRLVWRLAYGPMSLWMRLKFNFSAEPFSAEGPCLVISNHVTSWDPIMVALSFPDKPLDYVASEHIFRKGFLTKLLEWALSPIARRKGASGADTVMTIMRRVRKGASIGLFAEGDCTWDGRSAKIFPATGKLARSCGATLVTYRLEGGHLSLPRWGKGVRKGRMRGHVVGVYKPEELKAMKPEAITDIINRDIYEDAWERQSREPVRFVSKAPAENLQTMLYICPECGRVGTVRGEGAFISCQCGFSRKLTEYGNFEPAEPFVNPGAWDVWQKEKLETVQPDENGVLFSDTDMELYEVLQGHRSRSLGTGEICQKENELICCGVHFDLSGVEGMAIYTAQTLVFSHDGRYYEVKSKAIRCVRKYLDYRNLYAEKHAGEKQEKTL